MFTPKTPRIEALAMQETLRRSVDKIDRLLVGKTYLYIDFANVRPWSQKLGWYIHPVRLRQFLQSFAGVGAIKWYQGTLGGDVRSLQGVRKLQEAGYEVRTKPVKIMQLSINASSVSVQSPDLLQKFIRKALLRKCTIATVEFLNRRFKDLNDQGVFFIEDRKCNFDVEIGTDMRVDHLKDQVDTFVLWSGDSDFADPIKTLLAEGKRVVLFATAGRVARELNALVKDGLQIFDIFEMRDFISCTTRTKDPVPGAPQLPNL